jgi:hypothetical protein
MLNAWSNVVGTGERNRLRAKDVILLGDSKDSQGEPTHTALHDALQSIGWRLTGAGKMPDPKSFGKWLQSKKGRIVDGMKFAFKHDPKRGSQWFVEL